MCGIAGIVRFGGGGSLTGAASAAALDAMATALHHRGPDSKGTFEGDHGRVGLAHTRLAIIDPAGGAQPMSLPETERARGQDLVLVFNGEVYNYIELRTELEKLGHAFRTRSDTEVVLRAFAEWGDDALARFNGQWAIALWDGKRRRLLVSRDRVGIHPLYYAESSASRSIVFASEVKAIFAGDPSLRKGLDPIGLDQTFTFWAAIAPRTVFRGISELPPGHVRVWDLETGLATERAYFEHDFTKRFTGSIDDAETAVTAALERATALRMLRADVPVGCYVSGGLDSSLIAALGLRAKGGKSFHTFSLRFADAEYDETSYQQLVAKKLGTEHHEIVVSGDDIARVFPSVIRHAERPLLRTAPAPLFLLSKLVADLGLKVVLTGEGADEFFAGYDLFREGVVRRFWGRQPKSTMRPRLLQRLYPYLARSPVAQQEMAVQFFGRDLASFRAPGFTHGTRWSTTAAVKRLLLPEMRVSGEDAAAALLANLPKSFASWSPLAQDQHVEILTLLGPYLLGSQGDRMLMAHSVEGRFPFLDPDVIDLANGLPDRYKLRVLDEKHILKRVAKTLDVPPEILTRKKQPYRAPDALSFVSKTAAPEIDELLSESSVQKTGVLDPRAVQLLWKKCKARAASAGSGALSNTDNMALVAAISTQLVCRELLDGNGSG